MKSINRIGCVLGLLSLMTTQAVRAEDQSGHAGSGAHQMHEVMRDSAQKSQQMQMSGDVDKDFAQMMAHHHRTGIEMAQIEAEQGKDPELKALAQKIVRDQRTELQTLEKHADMHHGMHEGMSHSGMRGRMSGE